MINQLLLICSVIIIYEFIGYIQLIDIIKSNLKIYQKILKLFHYKNVSDFRIEKLILSYSKILLLISIKIIIILILIIFFIMILSLLSYSYLNFILSILGIIELSIILMIYHLIRRKNHEKL